MAENSVGEIALDLTVNDAGFQNKIKNTAKKAAGVLAGAFAVKEIVNFGKECLELGSDLAEVQNVVDVTFPTMNAQIDKFAKSATSSFGLSETMAKKFAGTFGSMAEAFGFSEKEAADMSTTLTGLAGDVASFYNISQDEAYTKLKSVFSGETETLKDLGIVMTQTALDSYAMANGFGKTTAKMSEMEKVSLRYAFVQDKLKNATGDFARTSDSWANQVRILSLQFDSLKASIGQGLINVFTPVIKLINSLIGRLVTLASAFSSFTELVMGKKSDNSGTAKTAESAKAAAGALNSASNSAKELKNQTKAAGKEAKKAAKEMFGIAGFDELNLFSSNKSDSDSDSGGTSSTGIGSSASIGKLPEDTGAEKLNGQLKAVLDTAKKVSALFLKGFKIGLGDTSVLDSIKKELKSIQKSIGEIFNDKKLQAAVKKWAASLILNFGKVAGSVASVGLTIADNLLGGIDKYLKQHKKDIIKDLTALFDITADTANIIGNFSVVLADIATVFRSDDAKQITADIINIFADVTLNTALLGQKIANSLISNITKPITQNKDKIKTALENTIKPLSTVINSISTFVSNTWDKVQSIYDKNVAPLIDSLGDGISGWMGTFLNGYNKYIAPTLSKISKNFKSVMEEHIQPAVDTVLDAFGDFCDTIKILREKWLQPFGNWIIKNLVPILSVILKGAADKVMAAISRLADVIKSIATAFSGVCKIIQNIAKGDWKAAWESLKTVVSSASETVWGLIKAIFAPAKEFFQGVWSTIKAVFSLAVGYFGSTFKGAYEKATGAFSGAKKAFGNIWSSIKAAFATVKNWFGNIFKGAFEKVTGAFSGAKKAFENVWSIIKAVFAATKEWFSSIFKGAYEKVVGAFSGAKKAFSNVWTAIKAVFATVKSWFGNIFKGAYEKVVGAFSGAKKAFGNIWSNIKAVFATVKSWFGDMFKGAYQKATGAFSGAKKAFSDVWTAIKKPFANVADWFKDKFSKAWEAVKNVFSSGGKIFTGIKDGIADTFKKIVNTLISGINTIIKKPFESINGMLNKIRDVGVMGAKPFKGLWDKNPLAIPKIPALANGGYVKPNTPQLAMIGDNRHQGEIVSPESKLQSMADTAAGKAGEVTAKALIPVIERLCNAIVELENNQGNVARLEGISNSGLYRLIKTEATKEKKRKGDAGYVL